MTAASLPNLARIPAGEFLMGAADADPNGRPVRRVSVDEFLIGRYAVTNDDYARFVAAMNHRPPAVLELPLVATGAHEAQFREIAAKYAWTDGRPPRGSGSHPVVLVRYEDAQAYCEWASGEFGHDFRLPTDAEWERAARGGVDNLRYPWGDDIDLARCNFLEDPAQKPQRGTRPAGTYPPNDYGLYDVIGNVWEWVDGWYVDGFHLAVDIEDPREPASGSMRIVRGGSWVNDDVSMLTCAYRHTVPPDTYAYSIGFRVACDP